MKLIFALITSLVTFAASTLPARSQTQVVEGFTFISGSRGPQVCLGRWIPSRDVALPGRCEGELVDVSQLTALSAKLSADRLDQALLALASIDQRLAVSNEQFGRLIEATVNTQALIDQQVRQVNELLIETIARRFEALPEEILANELFREEVTRLRQDILKEVEKRFTPRPTPQSK